MTTQPAVLDREGLDELVGVLRADGFQVIGPTVRDQAIVLAELDSGGELPAGWSVDAEPGRYRLRARDDAAVFAHSAGPQSWKQFLHPARRRLWDTDPTGTVTPVVEPPVRRALLGVRGCDLAAIAVLAGVLSDGAYRDESFARRREGLFIVAANCLEPSDVCFCASMGCGPGVESGYDLALTERLDAAGHRFLVDVGSAAGQQILDRVPHRAAHDDEVAAARGAVRAAGDAMTRAMPGVNLPLLIRESRTADRWQDVANRCLTCGNCTMVCPTCYCTSTEDVTDLTGEHAERWQHWASCFELDYSYLHGGSVRESGESRYRQWISHKLGTWHDQFGTSGCVGCGRCIAWCPAGIDITAEVAALAEEQQR